MRFQSFEQINEREQVDLKRVGMRVVLAVLAGVAVISALVLALPSG